MFWVSAAQQLLTYIRAILQKCDGSRTVHFQQNDI